MGFSDRAYIANNSFTGILDYGAYVFHDSNLVLLNNTFAYSIRNGLSVFDESVNVTVLQNTFLYNGFGLRAFGQNIIVFHNNFLFNEHQALGDSKVAWDNGYPEGGNYWSTHMSTDQCAGPSQDACSNPDGIGDVPYNCDQTIDPYCGIAVIGASVHDHYPLIRPFGSLVISVLKFTPAITRVGTGDGLLSASVELSQIPKPSGLILSSIRLNGKIIPIQADIVVGRGTNHSVATLVAEFNLTDLQAQSGKPGMSILNLSFNFLTESNFDELIATGDAHFVGGLQNGSLQSLS